MKKLLTSLLLSVSVLILASCGGGSSGETAGTIPGTTAESTSKEDSIEGSWKSYECIQKIYNSQIYTYTFTENELQHDVYKYEGDNCEPETLNFHRRTYAYYNIDGGKLKVEVISEETILDENLLYDYEERSAGYTYDKDIITANGSFEYVMALDTDIFVRTE